MLRAPHCRPVVAFLMLCSASSAVCGPLTPPAGVPGPTHKTLTEVEPRIPLNPADAPADALANFRITEPGSYYLTSDLQGFAGPGGPTGIVIEASDVTIDLGGYTLRGGFFTGDGIRVDGGRDNIVVRNGTVTGWAGRGIDLLGDQTGWGSIIESVLVTDCGGDGVRSGQGGIVRNATAHRNGGSGCRIARASVVTECIATDNDEQGFWLGEWAVASASAALHNGGDGFEGLSVTVRCCSAAGNAGNGIEATLSIIEDNAVRLNGAAGVAAGLGSVVRRNLVAQNGEQTGGVGILVSGFDSVIEENLVRFNGVGIRAMSGATGNLFARNQAFSNGVNWEIAAGNMALVVSGVSAGAIAGDAGGVSPGSTNPNANYSR